MYLSFMWSQYIFSILYYNLLKPICFFSQMDADYDPTLVQPKREGKKQKRKSKFAQAVYSSKPVFDPSKLLWTDFLSCGAVHESEDIYVLLSVHKFKKDRGLRPEATRILLVKVTFCTKDVKETSHFLKKSFYKCTQLSPFTDFSRVIITCCWICQFF